ncbi:MAG: ABC transporter ATP-binding protein [Lachnospirales bacterium]
MENNRTEKVLVELVNISKSYGDNDILTDFSLSVKENSFITLLGPSGCGKTTTLRIIGGFEKADEGQVIFNSDDITSLPPNHRQINTVFQKYALFPNMTVEENVAFGLSLKKIDNNIIKEEVDKMLELVALSNYNDRDISSLSGGQQQRVAIARALVNKPKLLLLDEPLGALDLKLRKEMQTELKKMQKNLGITFIYVTHDQEEALTMSDTIIVMKDGIVQQMGTAEDIYNEPENAFVADFIGESNIYSGIMKDDYLVELFGKELECLDKGFSKNENIDVVIRPEDVDLVDLSSGQFEGDIHDITFKGVHYEMIVDIMFNDKKMIMKAHSTDLPKEMKVGVYIEPDALHIMKKEIGG